MTHSIAPRRVVIVGAGAVGSTFAYALAQSGVCDEIGLTDANEELLEGQVLDLAHGYPYFPAVRIFAATPADYGEAEVIVLTAGARQRPGEPRLGLVQRNAVIVRGIVDQIVATGSGAVLVVVANPVDVLTHVALQRSGWPPARVIGSGTVLDSARLRYLLSHHCRVDVHNVHAYMLGEHGDSEFAAWSMTHIAGVPIAQYCRHCGGCASWEATRDRLEQQVRQSAYHIIGYKGATSFGVGMALVRIVSAILRSERSVLTVSSLVQGQHGLRDVCLSLPAVLSRGGVELLVEADLTAAELGALAESAAILRRTIDGLDPSEG